MTEGKGTADRDVSQDDRRALSAAVRQLAAATLLTTGGDDRLGSAYKLVLQALAIPADSARAGRYEQRVGLRPGPATSDEIWETHATFGASNPLSPLVYLVEEDRGQLTGTGTFGPAWEGGTGTVYGGFIAAVFDGMLGRAVISAGHLGVTKSLSVRFRRLTPLLRELRIESSPCPGADARCLCVAPSGTATW